MISRRKLRHRLECKAALVLHMMYKSVRTAISDSCPSLLYGPNVLYGLYGLFGSVVYEEKNSGHGSYG